MSGLRGRERLQPSLLDRLTDNNPSVKRDGPEQQGLTLPQLRQAVLRDLATLLNTSNLSSLLDFDQTPLAAKSTINYGIPALAGLLESASRVHTIEEELEAAIRTFEPRIRAGTLKVRTRGTDTEGGMPSLLFEIEGELWAQPVPVQLFLETKIEVETRLAAVSEMKSSH
jgi:type VI secretion system protein ImpF